MITIQFDTHITRQAILDMIEKAPKDLMYGNNYAGVTYRLTPAGSVARNYLVQLITDMRGRKIQVTKEQAQLLRILVTVYKNNDGWTSTAIHGRNLPVIVALYNAGIREGVKENTLPYYE